MEEKFVTIKDIAQKLGISVSSVSRALHNHPSISLKTRNKVRSMAKQLGYIPSSPAISFQRGKTGTIGVIVPKLSEPFFATALSAIENIATQRNYKILFGQSLDTEEKEKELVESMLHHRVEGLLISISKKTMNYSHLDALKRNHLPVVYFDCIPHQKNIHYVVCDLRNGTIEAMNYLLRKGHRTIGLINGPPSLFASMEREDGYFRALTMKRLKIDRSLIVSSDLSEAGTINAIETLLAKKKPPTAIITFNDFTAIYVINHLRKTNKYKKDLEFVSYANMPILKFMEYGPSASVEQFPYRQGEKSTEILLDLIQQKNVITNEPSAFFKVYVETQLIEKE